MMTIQEAKKIAQNYLKNHHKSNGQNPPTIIDSKTKEFSLGWVFFYQGKNFVEKGDLAGLYIGNAPLIVNKFSGLIKVTGTAMNIEHYVNEYVRQNENFQ